MAACEDWIQPGHQDFFRVEKAVSYSNLAGLRKRGVSHGYTTPGWGRQAGSTGTCVVHSIVAVQVE